MSNIPPRVGAAVLSEAERFLNTLDPYHDTRMAIEGINDGFTYQTFPDNKSGSSRELARVVFGEYHAVKRTLQALNKAGAGVFVTINETDMNGRKASNITRVRAVWIDDDGGAELICGAPDIEPHLITETSPGKYHKIFLVDGASFDDHRRLQEILIERWGSDPGAKDLARVLRLPGFQHLKGEPFTVRLIHESGAKPYSVEELAEALGGWVTEKEHPLHTHTEAEPEPTGDGVYRPITEEFVRPHILPDITLQKARHYLPRDFDQSRDAWLKIGIALFNQFEGSDSAMMLFDEWSSTKRAYQGLDDIQRTWDSFRGRDSGPKMSFKTVIKQRNEDLSSRQRGALLSSGGSPVATKILNDSAFFGDTGSAQVLVAGDDMEAYGMRDPILFNADGSEYTASAQEIRDGFLWCLDWVWVSNLNKFVRASDVSSTVSSEAFDGTYNSELKRINGKQPKSMSKYLRDNDAVCKVERFVYLPNDGKVGFYPPGSDVRVLNSYSDTSTQPLTGDAPRESIPAVEAFKRHIELTTGGWGKEAILLCNFLATCIRKPYTKIPWALLMTGAEGVGKSFFGEFLKYALGEANVNEVSGNTISSGSKTGFNSWAEGHLVCLIEEVKWQGESVFDILNNLKPVITNPTISCHRKGKDPYTVPNYANYILFSNHDDALHLSKGDRRYCVMRSEFPLDRILVEEPDYFSVLFGHIKGKHLSTIMKFLLDVPNHPDFDPKGRAPWTGEKEILVTYAETGMGDFITDMMEEEFESYTEKGYQVVDSDGLETIKRDRISLTSLVRRVIIAEGEDHYSAKKRYTHQVMAYLRGKNYVHITKRRIAGHAESIWGLRDPTKSGAEEARITELFMLKVNDIRTK